MKASYDSTLDEESNQWIVAAICSNNRTIDDATNVEVAVIPRKKVTPEITKKIRASTFTKLDCKDVWI
ncbi:hypothetical protein JS278_03132 [Acidipropionibacterium virtanenii]|uniref:Uncharacterized protein n=2 Tax=Acidipropionibacterium virtanenii TaxID=2057246 RepID=A0A344UYB8_9ACTN|nr:hypothetical protein JS278_03132 [Acidipropionibacterium virtanenii]